MRPSKRTDDLPAIPIRISTASLAYLGSFGSGTSFAAVFDPRLGPSPHPAPRRTPPIVPHTHWVSFRVVANADKTAPARMTLFDYIRTNRSIPVVNLRPESDNVPS